MSTTTRGCLELTNDLARALGLPKNTSRAVLTLAAGQPPRLDLTVEVFSDDGGPLVGPPIQAPLEHFAGRRIQQINFRLRLEPNP